MCNPIQALARGIENTLWAGQQVVQGAITLTAKVTKDVGGMRSVAASVVAVVDALDIYGVPVAGLSTLVQTCKGFNSGMGGIHVIQRAKEFADGSAFRNVVRLVSRIVFICYDILTSIEWLENMALVAKGTANMITFPIFGTSAKTILPTMSFVAYAMDLADHVYTFVDSGPSWDTGLSIGADVAKLVGIGLTGVSGTIPQLGKVAATVTATVIMFVKAAR